MTDHIDAPKAELENCPFCDGGTPKTVQLGQEHPAAGQWMVACTNYWCAAQSGYFPTEGGAVTAWNRRAQEREAAGVADISELAATAKQWHEWAFKWSGTAFIADEAMGADDMTEAEHKAELYSDLCLLGNHMAWLYDDLSALVAAPVEPKPAKGVMEALEWYADQVAGCRKITKEGEVARQALDADGGKRAREALAALSTLEPTAPAAEPVAYVSTARLEDLSRCHWTPDRGVVGHSEIVTRLLHPLIGRNDNKLTPLYAAPLPESGVSEAMVEQACEGFYPTWNEAMTEADKGVARDRMRGALTAALAQPEREGE